MKVTIEGVDRSSTYTPAELSEIEVVFVADQGEVGLGTLPVPTNTPAQEAYSGQQALIESGAGPTTILDGFVGAVTRDRNSVVNGTRQVMHYTLRDENALLGGHRANKWVRPAETDRARMLAANTQFLSHLSLDTTWVLNTNNETIPAKTYLTEDVFGELQSDCGDPTAKTLYIYNRELHWHRQTEGPTAGLSIVQTGENRSTTFALNDNPAPQRTKDGMDLALDVLARNDAGDVYSTSDAPGIALHDASGIRHQRLIEGGSATLAQITVMADRLLATYKNERFSYSGTIGPLTPAQVALIPPGSLITVTNDVWGLTSSVQRIAGLRLSYRHPDTWMAALELGYSPRLRVRPIKDTAQSSIGTGGQSGNGNVPCCEPWTCVPNDYRLFTSGGATAMGVVFSSHGNGQSADSPNTTPDMLYVYNGATYGIDYLVFHAAGSNSLTATLRASGGTYIGGPGSYIVGTGVVPAVYMGDHFRACKLDPTPDDIPAATTTWTADFTGYVQTSLVEGGCSSGDSYSSSISTHINYISGPDPRFSGLVGACSNGSPRPGGPVIDPPLTGDGTSTTGTTGYPNAYAPGSLYFIVNGIEWRSPLVTETDPTTGAYTLLYPFPAGATVIRQYTAPL